MAYSRKTFKAFPSLQKLGQQESLPEKISDDLYSPGIVLGSYFYIDNKPGGVEPGHLVAEIDQEFAAIINVIAVEMLSKLSKSVSSYTLPKNSRDVKYCKQLLIDHPQIAAAISEELRNSWKKK